jgi:hypothetical protein
MKGKFVYLTHVDVCDIEIPPEIFEKLTIINMDSFNDEELSKSTHEILDEALAYLR